jgi:hypothetical protein
MLLTLFNKESIRVEDLKIYEPVYKCYRENRNCHIYKALTNIICTNCDNSHNNNKEVWICKKFGYVQVINKIIQKKIINNR